MPAIPFLEVPSGQLGLEAQRWLIEFRNVKFREPLIKSHEGR